MGNGHFAKAPNISLPRTKMKQSFTHSTTFDFSKLVPIDCFEVLPGDSFSLKLSSLIRMSQPIAPIMDTIEMDIHAFFIPMRLIFKDTEEFFGANKTSAGYQKTLFRIPMAPLFNNVPNSVSSYLGKPLTSSNIPVSVLKERAYLLVWSEWYRAQQVQDPFVMLDSDDTVAEEEVPDAPAVVGHIGEQIYDLDYSFSDSSVPLMSVCKKMDYFTACTISPQYGEEVLLPLGSTAPVNFAVTSDSEASADQILATQTDVPAPSEILEDHGNVATAKVNGYDAAWYADLSKATAASVNQIRYAFQLQKYLERCNFGSRYFEMLANHYGVTSPDARLQRPEYLGGQHFYINVQQVLSTAGATVGSDTKLGQPGANSTTAHSGMLFSKGFVEFGYVLILASTRQASHKYSQGVLREDTRSDRFEFYSPEFANLGDQAVKNKEIMVTGTNDEKTFGYQEHWAEYRYRPDRVSGLLNPNATGALDYWTLADKYSSRPELDARFIVENRDNIKRALVTGNTGPDFVADFYFDYTAVREMPAYTIPGLIDHFGNH